MALACYEAISLPVCSTTRRAHIFSMLDRERDDAKRGKINNKNVFGKTKEWPGSQKCAAMSATRAHRVTYRRRPTLSTALVPGQQSIKQVPGPPQWVVRIRWGLRSMVNLTAYRVIPQLPYSY